MEQRHLDDANRHLLEVQERIARQELMVAGLERDSQDTTQAIRLLQNFKDLREQVLRHRDLIFDALRKSEGA